MQGQWFLPVRKTPVRISDLAKAPIDQLDLLPASAGIYFAVDNAERVWYIGRADSIRDRLTEHNQMPKFIKNGVALIAFLPEADSARCGELETEYIVCWHPPLNSQHNFNELPRVDLGLSPEAEVDRFLRLRIQQKVITLELDALAPNIVSQCEGAGGKLTHALGTVTCRSFQSWRFSDEARDLKRALLQRQKDEKQDGRAVVVSVTTSPRADLDGSAIISELAIRLAPLFDSEVAEAAEEADADDEPVSSGVFRAGV